MNEENCIVKVVPYDLKWPELFRKYAKSLRQVFGPIAVRIDHIGSTAVVGLPAKPVIDIQISLHDLESYSKYSSPLENIGCVFHLKEKDHISLRMCKDDLHLVNLHLCIANSDWEKEDRLFRDYLRAFPQIKDEYARLKYVLAEKYPNDLQSYWLAKGPFIVQKKQEAKEWANTTT